MKLPSNASCRTFHRYIFLSALLPSLMLTGCGQKGPLYLSRPLPVPGLQAPTPVVQAADSPENNAEKPAEPASAPSTAR